MARTPRFPPIPAQAYQIPPTCNIIRSNGGDAKAIIKAISREIGAKMSHPVAVTDASFQDEVVNSDTPVVVDFWAEWCGPCKAIAPIVEELAGEYDGKVKFAKMDVDSNPGVPMQFGIRGIPTLIIFNEGKAVDQVVGAVPKSMLKKRVDEAIAS